MSRNIVYTTVFCLVVGLVGGSHWAIYSFMPWLIKDVEEMSPAQIEVTKRHLTGNGIAISTDREEYAPGDTVKLMIANHTKMDLEYQPEDSDAKMLAFRIGNFPTRMDKGAFSIPPGNSHTVALTIPEAADPKYYTILTSYQHIDWAPGGYDLTVSAPQKQIKVVGPPPPPVPHKGRVEMVNEHTAEVYLGEDTYIEAVMGSKPLELRFHLPEGVGCARIRGASLNSYEDHAEYLYLKTEDGQPVSGSNVPPKIPAKVSFQIDLNVDSAESYGFVMHYQDWVSNKKPLLFKINVEMEVLY